MVGKFSRFPNGRLTLGLLTHGGGDPVSHFVWSGAAQVAQERDVNLICFPGKPLRSPHGYEAQSNVLYELVDTGRLDGLVVWLAGLTLRVDLQEVQDFLKRYQPLPMTTAGVCLPGIPGVTVDNYHSMHEVIVHLIEAHHCTRIAFVRGPENHQEAEDRYRGYVDALAEHGLAYDPERVVISDFKESGGSAALHELLDQRRVQFDALAAASDNMAIGALKALQARGVRVPDDIAIAGLNDEAQSDVISPPLTTSSLHFYEQGRAATEMVLDLIAGKPMPDRVVLPTRLLIRQSCGCPDPLMTQASVDPTVFIAEPFEAAFAACRACLLNDMTVSTALPASRLAAVIDAFAADIQTATATVFLPTLSEAIRQTAAQGDAVSRWHEVISGLRQRTLNGLGAERKRQHAENLWQQARVLIGETAQRTQAYQVLQAELQTQVLSEINQTLSATIDLDEVSEVLVNTLPRLDIPRFYLSLYENPAAPADQARLILAGDRTGRFDRAISERQFPARQLVPSGLLPPDRFSLIIEPLYFRADQLGFILLEADPRREEVYEILRGQISGALKRVLLAQHNIELFNEAVQARQVAEEGRRLAEEADSLKSRFLATVSHELRTPLTLIVGTIEMMLREEMPDRAALSASFLRDLKNIRASAQHLARLIGDVLDLASSQAGELRLTSEPLDLGETLKEVIWLGELMAREKGLAWRAALPDRLPLVWGDRTRLKQVVLNLIGNATKFTEQGDVTLAVSVEDQVVTVTVSDTGVGIAPEEQEAIFDEFHQSDRTTQRGYGGIGLGLAVTRRLIELHGGQIGVRSSGEEGAGSTFYFTLPVLEGSVAPADRSDGRSRVVLLITERVGAGAKLRAHLVRRGFEVEELAIEQNAGWLAQVVAAPPGAIVLDLQPAGELGWELMRSLKQNPATQDVPVIFYALAVEENSGSLFEVDYLTKPVDAADLLRVLERQGFSHWEVNTDRRILVVDDEPGILELHTRLIESQVPGCRVFSATNGRQALAVMERERPALVLLDLMMPEMDGFTVLEMMRQRETLRDVQVVVLTAQILTAEDMARLQQGVAVVLEKGLFSTTEVMTQISTTLARRKHLGSEAQRIVRQTMATIHERYAEPLTRDDLAQRLGVSERHLNRCFQQEMGLPPMTYLNRYRVKCAKELLEQGDHSVTEVALAVGFSDSNYFGRVFRQEVGVSPGAYQRGDRSSHV